MSDTQQEVEQLRRELEAWKLAHTASDSDSSKCSSCEAIRNRLRELGEKETTE